MGVAAHSWCENLGVPGAGLLYWRESLRPRVPASPGTVVSARLLSCREQGPLWCPSPLGGFLGREAQAWGPTPPWGASHPVSGGQLLLPLDSLVLSSQNSHSAERGAG